jgi:hypothetical protein
MANSRMRCELSQPELSADRRPCASLAKSPRRIPRPCVGVARHSPQRPRQAARETQDRYSAHGAEHAGDCPERRRPAGRAPAVWPAEAPTSHGCGSSDARVRHSAEPGRKPTELYRAGSTRPQVNGADNSSSHVHPRFAAMAWKRSAVCFLRYGQCRKSPSGGSPHGFRLTRLQQLGAVGSALSQVNWSGCMPRCQRYMSAPRVSSIWVSTCWLFRWTASGSL